MILDGRIVAADIKQRLKEEIDAVVTNGYRRPKLVIITVGDDPASKVYVRNKTKAAEEVGIEVEHRRFADDIEKDDVLNVIQYYNNEHLVDGIMVQLPLPKHLDERTIIDAISPKKDVDGLTTTNIGRLRSGQPGLRPCTAQGIIDLLDYYDIELDGKDVTIVGRSNIVGKPLADMMMAEGATVTQCHSHTRYLEVDTKRADILVSAIGKPRFLNDDYVAFGAVVIDVGINRDEEGKLCGDVDFEEVEWKAQHITPVPGGVGPMTVAELMKNTVDCWLCNCQN
jgi:methylenetetrahydrofolate dehydrogenase (NADP+)/methenyltetrahydrofolate cyclohydrolase